MVLASFVVPRGFFYVVVSLLILPSITFSLVLSSFTSPLLSSIRSGTPSTSSTPTSFLPSDAQSSQFVSALAATTSQEISYGENNFGDITGGLETLVIVGGSFTPMERIVISANGNLQRIMSAYYGAPVAVKIIKCDPLPKTANSNVVNFDREVELSVNGRIFCKAKGRIEIYDPTCVSAIEERKIGVGQLFRFLGALPAFKLLGAGRLESGSLWREYTLSCPQLKCQFRETFEPDIFNIPIEEDKNET